MEKTLQNLIGEPVSRWGFSKTDVEHLGFVALNKFNEMYGVNLTSCSLGQLKNMYIDLINDPQKYRPFVEWLKPRFDSFIELQMPMRIFVGGTRQFLTRGDKKLERALSKMSGFMEDYLSKGCTNSRRISATLYYLNLIL